MQFNEFSSNINFSKQINNQVLFNKKKAVLVEKQPSEILLDCSK